MLKSFVIVFAMFTGACLSAEEAPEAEEAPVDSDAVIQTEFCADLVVVTENVRMPCIGGTQLTTRTCVTDRYIYTPPTYPPTAQCLVGATTCTYVATSACK